jgi:hypothetical protein
MDNTSHDTPVNVNGVSEYNNNTSVGDLTNKTSNEIMSAMWALSPVSAQEISNISRVYSSKHGLFSSIPILCKNQDCAYKDVCMVNPMNRVVGQRCPMEIAAILARYELWCQHFEIDTSNDEIDPKDLVDATLIKDLVNIEVQMLRAENKIALNGDFMADTLLDIDKKCRPYYGKIVAPETEFLLTLQQRKEKILNQLNATRKDKAAENRRNAPSDEAIKIFKQIKDMEQQNRKNTYTVSDIEFDEDGNVIVVEDDDENPSEINTVIDKGGD